MSSSEAGLEHGIVTLRLSPRQAMITLPSIPACPVRVRPRHARKNYRASDSCWKFQKSDCQGFAYAHWPYFSSRLGIDKSFGVSAEVKVTNNAVRFYCDS